MKKIELSLEDKLYELQVKVNKMRPVPRQTLDPSARVLDALDRGEDLVATKVFQGANQSYQPGDIIQVEGWGKARLGQMGAHGYIIPAGEYSQSIAYQAAADLLENKLTPLLSTLSRARNNAQKAGEKVAAAAAELLTAQQAAKLASSQVEYWEGQLSDALKGEDVTAIFG